LMVKYNLKSTILLMNKVLINPVRNSRGVLFLTRLTR